MGPALSVSTSPPSASPYTSKRLTASWNLDFPQRNRRCRSSCHTTFRQRVLVGVCRLTSHHRLDDRRCLRQLRVLDVAQLEAGGPKPSLGVAVAVAAVAEEAPGLFEAVLPLSEVGMVRADVL